MYGDEAARATQEKLDLHRERQLLAGDLPDLAQQVEVQDYKDAFVDAVVRSLALPFRAAKAVEDEATARLEEARAAGEETAGLEAEAEETRRRAREVRERATARLLGDEALGPLLEQLGKTW